MCAGVHSARKSIRSLGHRVAAGTITEASLPRAPSVLSKLESAYNDAVAPCVLSLVKSGHSPRTRLLSPCVDRGAGLPAQGLQAAEVEHRREDRAALVDARLTVLALLALLAELRGQVAGARRRTGAAFRNELTIRRARIRGVVDLAAAALASRAVARIPAVEGRCAAAATGVRSGHARLGGRDGLGDAAGIRVQIARRVRAICDRVAAAVRACARARVAHAASARCAVVLPVARRAAVLRLLAVALRMPGRADPLAGPAHTAADAGLVRAVYGRPPRTRRRARLLRRSARALRLIGCAHALARSDVAAHETSLVGARLRRAPLSGRAAR
jgi:hypothetical protein